MYTSSSRVQELVRHFENHFEIIDSTYKEIEILTYLLRYTLVTDQIPEIAISRTNYPETESAEKLVQGKLTKKYFLHFCQLPQ